MNNYPVIHSSKVSKMLLFLNMLMATAYFAWWLIPGHIGNPLLYSFLFFGEMYHVFMAYLFWITLWPKNKQHLPHGIHSSFEPSVDIFIPVAGEPVEIVKETVIAAQEIEYKNKKIYILNDGYVANKNNWLDMEILANELGIQCITRKQGGGAKAGNINHALHLTDGEIIVIFDADMKSHPDFLTKVIPYFQRDTIGFVQTPQYYQNHELNNITAGAWEQQEFFFGPIMIGKNNNNATFICGTNVAIRRQTIQEVGGMFEKNIAEDFVTSLFIHEHKWKSVYISEVLAEGLAPEDLLSYYKQQHRWARGSLEVLFQYNPFFRKGLSFKQKFQYLSSALYYFNGVITVIDMVMPLLFFFFNVQPVAATTTSFALFFVPYMFLSLYTLFVASNKHLTFRAMSFSQASWTLQLSALKAVIFHEKSQFVVTSKQAKTGNFISLVYPHIAYIILSVVGFCFGVAREGLSPAIMTNTAWVLFNSLMFMPFIISAIPMNVVSTKQLVLSNAHNL